MIKICDCGIEEFQKQIQNKKMVIWGAGKATEMSLQTICCDADIIAIADNNQSLWQQEYIFENKHYPIIGIPHLCELLKEYNKEQVIIFIASVAYAGEILQQLNQVSQLDGINCYVRALLLNWYEKQEFSFPIGTLQIPKKIHYCWFGGKEIPDHLKRCMETWKKFCPDYEIIRWDESNYDYTKNQYMKEAYECGKWGFVPDYARLDIIYQEGGIYLDTDVELVASLDPLLHSNMFCGFGMNYTVNFGNGFGAIAHHPMMLELRDVYDKYRFIRPDGTLEMISCPYYQHPILQKKGFLLTRNQFQQIDDCVLYPSEVLSPYGLYGLQKHITDKTIAIHHGDGSWCNENMNWNKALLLDIVSNIDDK